MSLARNLAILSLVAAVAVGTAGCKPRGQKSVADQERGMEDARSASALRAENAELKSQLAQAREELEKNQGGTVGDAAGNLGVSDLGEGWKRSNVTVHAENAIRDDQGATKAGSVFLDRVLQRVGIIMLIGNNLCT